MSALVTYTAEEKALVKAFAALPAEERKGFWDNTHEGKLGPLKAHIKRHYLQAQEYRCPYCRQAIVVDHLGAWDAEHIVPKDKWPEFMFEPLNLCIACKDCNGEKWNQDVLAVSPRGQLPTAPEAYRIVHPHLDTYDEHIKVIRAAGFYLPKTDKGRKTVEVCGLLRFLYDFANVKPAPDNVEEQLQCLQMELLEAEDRGERHFLLEAVAHTASEGARQIRETWLRERFAAPAAEAPE